MQQLERYTSPSQTWEWVCTIFSLWIDYSDDLLRDDIWDSMMIRDDNIDPERFCMTDRFDISSSTIDSDDESDSFFMEFIEKICLQSISIMDSMRESV